MNFDIYQTFYRLFMINSLFTNLKFPEFPDEEMNVFLNSLMKWSVEPYSKPEIGRFFGGVYDKNHITSAPFYAHLIYVKCPFLLRNPQNTSLLRHRL